MQEIIFLSFFTGHIITAPAVSLIAIILILEFPKRKKKRLLFASFSMDLGGIEKALLNLVNRIDLDKDPSSINCMKVGGIMANTRKSCDSKSKTRQSRKSSSTSRKSCSRNSSSKRTNNK